MPCSDNGETLYYETKDLREKIKALQERNDLLANMLCNAGRHVLFGAALDKRVEDWWELHRKFDEDNMRPWEQK